MPDLTTIFTWKVALIWHSIFFSFAMLQDSPKLGMIWLIINTFVFLLLLRANYGPPDDKVSNGGMAWYFYGISIPIDFLSLCVFGHYASSVEYLGTFVLVMAIFMLVPKPLFAFYLLKDLQRDGFNIKQGIDLRKDKMPTEADSSYQGFAELEQQIQDNPGAYVVPQPPPPQPLPQTDIVIVPNEAVSPRNSGGNNINESLMDNVAPQDVFTPGS